MNEDNRSQRTWKETQSPLLPPAPTWSGGKKTPPLMQHARISHPPSLLRDQETGKTASAFTAG